MPAKFDGLLPTTSHWGAYGVRADADGVVEVAAHADDPAPSPLLDNVADSLRHRSRIQQPAIRRGWLEGGPGHDRGRDDFVSVDWDTALDLLSRELGRVRRKHGNEAIFGGSYGWASAGRFHHAPSQLHRFLNCIGGYTGSHNSYSLGTSLVLLPHLVGDAEAVLRAGSSWPTIIDNTELLVAFGGIPAKNVHVSPGGVTTHQAVGYLSELASSKVEVASVTPLRTDVPDALKADWYPVSPGTDTALMLALAHTLLARGWHDEAFLQRYCAGFDTVAAYLRGDEDGIPKNAAWAADLTGIDAARITDLARRMANSRTLVTVTWSLQRAQHGEQPVWAGLLLAAMLGQIGLPGGGFGHGYGSMADVGDTGPLARLPSFPQGTNPVETFIPCARIADMLLHPGETFSYDGHRYEYPDIRLVYWAGGNPFHHHQDLGRLRRAFRRPETVVVHEPYWTATAKHADIVLPTTTTLEREDIGAGRRDSRMIAMHQVSPAVGQARDDHRIFADLAGRMGGSDAFTLGRTPRQWLRRMFDDWRAEVNAKSDARIPGFDAFWSEGECVLPAEQSDRTLFADFRADPHGNPLSTPSGRIELTSERVASFELADCPGHPTWLEPVEWWGSASSSGYPLMLIANQPDGRLHSQLDFGAASRAGKVAGREALTIHPDDAAARGILAGDVVRVFNDRGACLAGAVLDDGIRPGVLRIPTGAWFTPAWDERDGRPFCLHGNPNVLTADIPSSTLSQGCVGQHALVEVHRYQGTPPQVAPHEPPVLVAAHLSRKEEA